MRCSCHVCDTYMVQSEGLELGCVCPACGYRCKACLGTDTVVRREDLARLAQDRQLMQDIFTSFDSADEGAPLEDDDTKWGDAQWTD